MLRLSILAVIFVVGSAQAQTIYRYQDKAGNVTYSQTKPQDVKAVKVIELNKSHSQIDISENETKSDPEWLRQDQQLSQKLQAQREARRAQEQVVREAYNHYDATQKT